MTGLTISTFFMVILLCMAFMEPLSLRDRLERLIPNWVIVLGFIIGSILVLVITFLIPIPNTETAKRTVLDERFGVYEYHMGGMEYRVFGRPGSEMEVVNLTKDSLEVELLKQLSDEMEDPCDR